MTGSYLRSLVRDAIREPQELPRRRRFWKPEFWERYLRVCADVLFDDPPAGLVLTQPVPELAARIADTDPSVVSADIHLIGLAFLGSAYRRNEKYQDAERLFVAAGEHQQSATPGPRADYLRRLAYLRIVQHDRRCFPLIEDAIRIHKRGNLVELHAFGKCLICRGHAYAEFGRPDKTLDDWTAALNHISFTQERKTYFIALHNLLLANLTCGDLDQARVAYKNLQPVLKLLHPCRSTLLAKTRVRWVQAILETRLEIYGRAELNFLKAKDGLVKLGLSYELGMLITDLAQLYLKQGRVQPLRDLLRETAHLYRRMGAGAQARRALDILRRANGVDEPLLQHFRERFTIRCQPAPKVAA